MSSHACNSHTEAMQVKAILEQMGHPGYVTRSTISTPEPSSVLQKALRRAKKQQELRDVAERYVERGLL